MINKRFIAIATVAGMVAGSSLTAFAAPSQGNMPQGGPGGQPGMTQEGSMMQDGSQMQGGPMMQDGSQMQGGPMMQDGSQMQSGPMMQQGSAMQNMGERPELPEGVEEGEMPELPEGVEEGEMPELPEGVEEGEMPELPEGMEEGEMPELPEGAEPGDFQGMRPPMDENGGFDLSDKLTEMIASVEDEDQKEELQALADELIAALDAEREGLDSGECTEEELETLRSNVDSARTALDEAMEEAGVEMAKEPEAAPADKPQMDKSQSDTARPDMPQSDTAQSDTTSETSQDKGFFGNIGETLKNGFSKIGNWFKGIFNK